MNPTRPPGTGGYQVGWVFVQDRVRIEVALEQRERYKYVRPRVEPEGAGWKVVSPNCSRNIDRHGGDIDIAWLLPLPAQADGQPGGWLLHRRHHAQGAWTPCLHTASLPEALERLVRDPHREFWV